MAAPKKDLALLFDFGGVITESPFIPLVLYATSVIQTAFTRGSVRFDEDEIQPNLFGDVVWFSKVVNPPGIFKKLETGEFSRDEFVKAFDGELATFLRFLAGIEVPHPPNNGSPDAAFEKAIRKIRSSYSPEKFTTDVCSFLRELVDAESFVSCSERVPFRAGVVAAIGAVKEVASKEGINVVTAVITNNWQQAVNMKRKGAPKIPSHLADTPFVQFLNAHMPNELQHVDHVVESVQERVSKPDPAIFRAALTCVKRQFQQRASSRELEAVFMDDLPYNLAGATNADCGVTTTVRIRRQADVFGAVVAALEKVGLSAQGVETVKTIIAAKNASRIQIRTLPDRVITAIPEKQQFTAGELDKLRRCLTERLPHHFAFALGAKSHVPLQIEYFKGGMSNPTFRLTAANGSYVLRKQPKGKLLKGAHDMRREYELFTFLGSRGIPVPKTFCYVADATVIGTPFYMMRYTCGHIMRSFNEMSKASPQLRAAAEGDEKKLNKLIAKNIGNFFAAAVDGAVKLHRAGVPDYLTKGRALVAPTNPKATPLYRLASTWQRQYDAGNKRLDQFIAGGGKPKFPSMRNEMFDQLTKQLMTIITENIPCPEKLVLCHGDYKLDNMIYDIHPGDVVPGPQLDKGPSLLAMLDFELSALGDPIADIAYCSMFYFLPPPRGILGLEDEQRSLYPTGRQLLEQYCAETGHWAQFDSERRAQLLCIYQAANLHKLCGIMHGVVVRALVGNASDVQGGLALHEAFELLAETGLGLIEESGLGPKTADSKL